jgi:hypothetical protein
MQILLLEVNHLVEITSGAIHRHVPVSAIINSSSMLMILLLLNWNPQVSQSCGLLLASTFLKTTIT